MSSSDTPSGNQLKALKIIGLERAITRITTALLHSATICFVSYLGYKSIACIAGKTTLADIRIFASIISGNSDPGKIYLWSGVLVGISGLFVGGLGLVYGNIQKNLRQEVIERLAAAVEQLEKLHDPNRSSSGLTRRGETREEDR